MCRLIIYQQPPDQRSKRSSDIDQDQNHSPIWELANNPGAAILSPKANLAMYRETLNRSELTQVQFEAAARYLGTALDKRSTISEEMVEALNIILGTGLNLTNEQVNAFFLEADGVRTTIVAAHNADEGFAEDH